MKHSKFQMLITYPSENVKETNMVPDFTNMTSFNPYNNPMMWCIFLVPFHKERLRAREDK